VTRRMQTTHLSNRKFSSHVGDYDDLSIFIVEVPSNQSVLSKENVCLVRCRSLHQDASSDYHYINASATMI
jgi:hypothetical protein